MATWDPLQPYCKLLNMEAIEPREYQLSIAKGMGSGKNTLLVLPTGLGKTIIGIFAMARVLYEGKKVIILAPTKPLSEQHLASIKRFLKMDENLLLLLTGRMKTAERKEREREARVIAATPQTIANDIKVGRLNLDGFGMVIFDECHRAVGKYAYTYIANECKERGIQQIGMTASPGSDRKKIDAIISTLGIEEIEMRISTDMDVAEYAMGTDIRIDYIDNGMGVGSILGTLKPVIEKHLTELYRHGLSPFKKFDNLSKGRLLEMGTNISKIEAQSYKFMALYDYVYLLHLSHAYDMAGTEGIQPFLDYFKSLEERERRSRAVQGILKDAEVQNAIRIAREMIGRGEEHPKMGHILGMMNGEMKGHTTIIFAQYRSTIRTLASMLRKAGIEAREFVGKKDGTTQEGQRMTIEDFRNGKFNVLVSTSIGEEGLDIPSVDYVVFYEPVASEIRNIQRKGRAGRVKFGRVVILVSRNTKDEAYLMISRIREKRMRDNILKIKESLRETHRKGKGQMALGV